MQPYKVDLGNLPEAEREHYLAILKHNSYDFDRYLPYNDHVYMFLWNSEDDILTLTGLSTDRVERL